MSNYKKVSLKDERRVVLHDLLQLTGAEISLNHLPANTNIPFVHAHKENEEIYGITEGNGYIKIDGVEIPLTKGDWLRVDKDAERQIFALDQDLLYICIQVKENSLNQFSKTDGIII
ncbi:MAG: cupin domain-containing protein [Anaeroplasmataceae bacterium]